MDRRPHLLRYTLLVLLALAATLAASGGCTSVLFTAIYLVKGNNLPAEFDGLREKRVAVVCRPLVGLNYRDASVADDLAREIHKLLAANVRKVEMIDQRKVDEWVDEHSWEEYNEVGKALEADYVVGVDLESFSILEGQTVYQGKADVLLKVFDGKQDDPVFERRLPEIVYPPNNPRSSYDERESEFRREYIGVLADQIARHFYPHDPHADFAQH